jgi:Tol biopolymer transport system component
MRAKPVITVVLLSFLSPALWSQVSTQRLSWDGNPGSWRYPSGHESLTESTFITSDGRFTAFVTDIRNAADDDSLPGYSAVVRKDVQNGPIDHVSVGVGGAVPNGPSFAPTVSTDGRYACFTSWASNIVAGDGNNNGDVFWRDMQTGVTKRVTVPYDAVEDQYDGSYGVTHAMSDDGRFVVFTSASFKHVAGDTNDHDDVFVRDMTGNTTYLISRTSTGGFANGGSMEPRISRDGRYVVFMSFATDLVPGVTTPTVRCYMRDRQTNTTSLLVDGGLPAISGTGRYVAYATFSASGGDAQTYRYDTQTKVVTPVSVAPDGVTLGNRDSIPAAVSDDGRYVCFVSKARNLVTGDTNDEADVFVRDLTTGTTKRISVAKDGLQGNRQSGMADLSGDAKWAVFTSASEDLVAFDLNEATDVFVRGPLLSGLSMADAASALRIAGGKSAAAAADAALDVVRSGPSSGRVDVADAVAITRGVAGLN